MNIRAKVGKDKFLNSFVLLAVCFLFFYATSSYALANCINNTVQGYPCHNVHFSSHVSLDQLHAERTSDLWGWTDAVTGNEYVLIGHSTGVSVVDISDPDKPAYLGVIMSPVSNPNPKKKSDYDWRDIRTYGNYAYIVSEAENHGLQVFDLTQLRGLPAGHRTFSSTYEYKGFGHAHNISINTDSGFSYVVGSSTCGAGGLLVFDLSTPQLPVSFGCFFGETYSHDSQCLNYHGPDPDYQGSEICINSNPNEILINLNSINIVDVTDKYKPFTISETHYPFPRYAHQGWLTEDHTYFLFNDELDEFYYGLNTGTLIFDVRDLDNPIFLGRHHGATKAADHNLFVHKGFVYEANYTSGLSVLSTNSIRDGKLMEIGFFDVYPPNNNRKIDRGAWGIYPFFDSGAIAVSSIESGLFILKLGENRTAVPMSARNKNATKSK